MNKKMKYSVLLTFVTIFSFFLYYVLAVETDLHDGNCECINYDCGCCAPLKVPDILDGKLCSNFSYLPDQYGISVTVTYNDIAILNETVSAKNPPPLCLIHFDEVKMEICLRFYDLDIKDKCFSGCAEFDVSFFKIIHPMKLKLGCFGCHSSTLNTELQYVLHYLRAKLKQHEEQPRVVLI